MPIIRLVVIITPGVLTPRAVMQAWLASITTATPLGWRCSPDAVGDLRGQPLLDLQAPGEAVEHARQLADSDHLVARQIGDRRLADDRRHMMLAMRLERDVLQQHDLVIAADLLEGPGEVDRRVLGIAAGIFAPGPRHALRRVEQAFAVGVVAGPADQVRTASADLAGDVDLGRGFDQVAVFGVAMFAHALKLLRDSSATAAACPRISGTAMISQ